MSKKHRHKHYFEEEHTPSPIISEEQLIILIAIILIFGNRDKPTYHIQKKKNVKENSKEDVKPFSFDDSIFSAESGFETEIADTPAYNDEYMDSNNLNEAEAAIFDVNASTIEEISQANPIIANSSVKIHNITTLQCCSNDNIEDYVSLEPSVSKIPILIAQPEAQIHVDALTSFPEPIYQIKDIDKNIFLSQCKLIAGSDKLFIKGTIQESIMYATADCIKSNTISGSIKKVTFNIPFQCSTKVFFAIKPQFSNSYSTLNLNILNANEYGMDIIEKSYGHFEALNEKIFTELNSIKILETDIQEEIAPLENTLQEAYTFEAVRKKMTIKLVLNIFQNQNIFISDTSINGTEEETNTYEHTY